MGEEYIGRWNNILECTTQNQPYIFKQMKATSSKSEIATGLRELFEDSLKDIYYAEKALTKALPKMADKAVSGVLVEAIKEHLSVTEGHVKRLEEVFEVVGMKAEAKKCEAIEGLIKEGQETMSKTKEGVVRDAGIIASSQKVEHYEIATYGTLVSFAKTLGEKEAVRLLKQTLEEEKVADKKLSAIAESAINEEASN
jgi:ferritin-like metal-binding protein YciE